MKHTLHHLLSAVPEMTPLTKRELRDEVRNQPILALRYDSRLATGGTVFFCLVGKVSDGHSFAPSAYRNGCRLFVVERELKLPKDALQILVPNTRTALADCSAAFYDYPQRHMRLIGLTGTKGKTTTALLIRGTLLGAVKEELATVEEEDHRAEQRAITISYSFSSPDTADKIVAGPISISCL